MTVFANLARLRTPAMLPVFLIFALPVAPAAAQPVPPKTPQVSATGEATSAVREAWRRDLLKQTPPKTCFTATYPEKTYREIACKPPVPHPLYFPQRGGATSVDVVGGAGPDFSATVTGHITKAEGSFDSVTGVTNTGAYSLQVNTAPFATSTCSGSPNPGACQGWEQFVYESTGVGFIQYWLLTYGPAGTQCPLPRHTGCAAGLSYSDGWCPFQFTPTGSVYCVVNAAQQAPAPARALNLLHDVKLAGAAAGSGGAATDSITVSVSGVPFGANGNNSFPDLGTRWSEVEFNVFGDGNSSQANFNSGSNLVVRTEVISGTTSGPGCHLKSWTGESTNLTLLNAQVASPAPGPGPALVFGQTNPAPSGALATCADAISQGDTHLHTFRGLAYDFQASGDFVLAETGRNFQVQTRQVSGAPNWPNATVNKAVAVRSGRNKVAICLPAQVFVDGRATTIADNGRVKLSDGGAVIRKGSVYYVIGQSGDMINATLNPAYIDVSVGLANWPNKNIRGLLADAGVEHNQVATRGGTLLAHPLPFDQLYGEYATSWRVPWKESLMMACGDTVKDGVPDKPFYARDLDAQTAERTQSICVRAGAKKGPNLDACMIDVAWLGEGAAKGYAKLPQPVAVGDAPGRK